MALDLFDAPQFQNILHLVEEAFQNQRGIRFDRGNVLSTVLGDFVLVAMKWKNHMLMLPVQHLIRQQNGMKGYLRAVSIADIMNKMNLFFPSKLLYIYFEYWHFFKSAILDRLRHLKLSYV